MVRIYTEIRIAHESQEAKEAFELNLEKQSWLLLGQLNKAEYIRQIININAATGIIEKLKSE